ncbi:MAG: cobaltochelatase subunit CobN [Alphaproteobacteria bacterium]
MHLLNVQPGAMDDGGEAVDMAQSGADIVILSTADTELATFAAAHEGLADAPSLRLANLLHLKHPMSVDTYVRDTLSSARLVIVRLLGGASYWPYGLEQVVQSASQTGALLAVLPGDDKPDPTLMAQSSLDESQLAVLWEYFVHGGMQNAGHALAFGAHLLGKAKAPPPPKPLLTAGLYWPDIADPSIDDLRKAWRHRPVAAITFYRALVQSGQTQTIDAMVAALDKAGLNALPVFAKSFRDEGAVAIVARVFDAGAPDIVINTTGFALSAPGVEHSATVLDQGRRPVLQAVLAASSEAAWRETTQGLGARDMAMNVALPEVDGRIHARAIAFKAQARFDALTQSPIVVHRPQADRVKFVAEQAASWVRLASQSPARRRVALVLANYPNRDGRIGNGVGLDTPASAALVIGKLAKAGYDVGAAPRNGAALMKMLLAGPTNSAIRSGGVCLNLARYKKFFAALPKAVRQAVSQRWGAPENDPFVDAKGFALPVHQFANLAIAIQPARGYNIDPKATYHDPDLVPPHGYLAFYAWMRQEFGAHAMVQMGKHGNLEWLPGKGLALSDTCFPEITLGPLPLIYPFIVNDPGEGAQAKRRAGAVVIDHLTPPLTRAETYGALSQLEALVDEYFEAAQGDPARATKLQADILAHARTTGLDDDCGIEPGTSGAQALTRLDNHLCDLKEMQIRDGLHIFGTVPKGGRRDRLIVALARVPRGAAAGDASLQRAIAQDLTLNFDPLDCVFADPWPGPRPQILAPLATGAWRTNADTVERIEALAELLVSGKASAAPAWAATNAVLGQINTHLCPAVNACGAAEIAGLLRALDGQFVAPGPSGAPTRGRPDVLPTGRNFYSLDTRAVPTKAAWSLGEASARLLVEDYAQRHGDWPRHMALSAWGTANMRTGGDDIAQGLALIGARPTWDGASRRVTGFDILPPAKLGRPRVDVTLRVSGFFRDAFPGLIDLFDAAIRAIAALDEKPQDNPLAARVAEETARFVEGGHTLERARRLATYRVFSSKPGAYGAGLQTLIDEKIWDDRGDFADAFIAWSAFAYGGGTGSDGEGEAVREVFTQRLAHVEAVIHNQDNREHDLLDSDDYYQFEGGMSAAVERARGARPVIYHNDHSRVEKPIIRTLEEEIARVVRGRAANPKWIAGMMRHGYKGAFEISATVDYLFAFQATTGAVRDHHFDALFDAYLGDSEVRDFLEQNNKPALLDIAARFAESLERGLWRPRANTVYDQLERILKGDK